MDTYFLDPPYYIQAKGDLKRPDKSEYKGTTEYKWDEFDSYAEYDQFCLSWLKECKRTLKETGSLFVCGTYHNLYRIGYIMQELGYWLLNDIVWIKNNPTPNFKGTRFVNGHESIIWASKHKDGKYKFNYQVMKQLNHNKQMRAEWQMPAVSKSKRILVDGEIINRTQKPEELVYRCVMATTDKDDLVVDGFLGTGTTGVVCKQYNRKFIGIESNLRMIQCARTRINNTTIKLF